jgi:hypothetical protein
MRNAPRGAGKREAIALEVALSRLAGEQVELIGTPEEVAATERRVAELMGQVS